MNLPTGNQHVNPQDIYQRVIFSHAVHMDMGEIRKTNMRRLIREKFDGVQKSFANAIDRQPDYVSRCLSGRKKIGEDFARLIEEKLNLPMFSLDQDHSNRKKEAATPPPGSRVLAWESLDDLPDKAAYVTVAHHDVHLSAGDGADAEWLEHADNEPLVFRARFFQARGLKPSQCRALYVRGASMEPTLLDGDTVLIDTTRTTVEDDAVYALLYHGELYIKRLFRLPGGGIALKSDNERHPTREVQGEDLNQLVVLGRSIWRAG